MTLDLLAYALLWLTCSLVVSLWAVSRGHSGLMVFFVSMTLSPVVGFLLEVTRKSSEEGVDILPGAWRKCSSCDEFVHVEAIVCRFCGATLVETSSANLPSELKSRAHEQ